MKSFNPGIRKHHVALVTALMGVVAFACGGSDSGGGDTGGSSSGNGSSGNGSSGASSSGASSSGASSSGASSSGASSSGASSSGSTSSSSSSSGSSGDGGTTKGAIFVMLFENHDYNEIIGSPNAPYFNSLVAKYGLATNYLDSGTHPSLPNYLTIISGDPQYLGIVDLDPTSFPFPVDKPNLGTQMEAAGVKWRSYQESMGTACKLSAGGTYAPKHDPFLYFTDQQKGANNLCANTNVDYTQFAGDLAAGTYRFSFITPNLTDDGHDPSGDPVGALKTSDAWAKTEIDKIMASDAYKKGGVIFITWDEAEGRNGNSADQIPLIVVSENIKSAGVKVTTKYSHKTLLATLEDMMGLPRLDTVKAEANMATDFLK